MLFTVVFTLTQYIIWLKLFAMVAEVILVKVDLRLSRIFLLIFLILFAFCNFILRLSNLVVKYLSKTSCCTIS